MRSHRVLLLSEPARADPTPEPPLISQAHRYATGVLREPSSSAIHCPTAGRRVQVALRASRAIGLRRS